MCDTAGMEIPKFATGEASHALKPQVAAVGQASEQRNGRSPRGGLVALVTVAGLFNVLVIPLLEASSGPLTAFVFAPVFYGVMLGQVGALALWLVWGEGPFLRRLALHWCVGLLLASCLMVGSAVQSGAMQPLAMLWNQTISFLCVLPAVSLAAQLPLWPLRTHFGWSVERLRLDMAAGQPAPLSILDIFSGTAVVAISLGLLRAAVSPIGGSNLLLQIGVPLGIVVAAGAICLLPVTVFVLRPRESRFGAGMLAGYIFLTVFGTLAVTVVLTRSLVPTAAFFSVLTMCFALAATLASPLLVLRACGYRLVWPRDRRRA
jgi:hypothetical protein